MAQFKDFELDSIWDKIIKNEYSTAAFHLKDFTGTIILYPMKIYSDETGDMMSIPSNGGYGRDIYQRKCGSAFWLKICD
jgi:hypothetical protein